MDILNNKLALKAFGIFLHAGTDIPNVALTYWDPSYYVLITPTITIDGNGKVVFGFDPDMSGIYYIDDVTMQSLGAIDSASNFAKAVHRGEIPSTDIPRKAKLVPGSSALEVTIKQNCYIVLNLKKLNWQFAEDYFAITIDPSANPIPNPPTNPPDPATLRYGDLHQIDATGADRTMARVNPPPDTIPAPAPIGDNCEVGYFSVRVMPQGVPAGIHQFNLHVQIRQGNEKIGLTIDPDIKNDGNQPTWPP